MELEKIIHRLEILEQNNRLLSQDNARLSQRCDQLEKASVLLKDRNEISNLMSKYMLLHAAFRDEEIIDLWAKREDVHAEYGNVGVYEGYKNVTDYHRGRPNPPGKWIFHSLSNEVLEVAADGKTAKGVWLLSGTESGHGPAQDNNAPENFYCKGIFDGCRVWAHWVWSRYGVDFIKEDGTWKFWHFHNYELLRTPFDENWVTYNMRLVKEKSGNTGKPEKTIQYAGNNGEIKYFPEPDRPSTFTWTYDGRTSVSVLAPPLPEPYTHFEETFEY